MNRLILMAWVMLTPIQVCHPSSVAPTRACMFRDPGRSDNTPASLLQKKVMRFTGPIWLLAKRGCLLRLILQPIVAMTRIIRVLQVMLVWQV